MKASLSWSLAVLVLAAGCATSSVAKKPAEDKTIREGRVLVGLENQVRLTARLATDRFAPNSVVALRYEVENRRDQPIAIADIVSDTQYDSETQVITVNVGSEVPGNELLPRLVKVDPGQTRTFNTSARIRGSVVAEGTQVARPHSIRVNLHFLTSIEPFAQLIDIPEKALHDPALADSLFSTWVDHTQTVITNDLPVRWGGTNTVSFGGPGAP